MTIDHGRSASPSGYSAEPEPSYTVSAVPVSIPNAGLLEGERYSPNLRKWLRRRRGGSLLPNTQVFQAPDGVRYIGARFEDDNWLHGAQLMRVLCVGSKAETYAYAPDHSADWRLLEDFWERYAAVGRCAIDPEHTGWWGGERWNESGDERVCRWCGFEQHKVRWTETVSRERWEPASAIEARRAATAETGAVHESAIGAAETPNTGQGTSHG